MTARLPVSAFEIAQDDLAGDAVQALLQYHLGEMHAWSPACKVNAMPVDRLRQPDVTFYSARHEGRIAAVGALKHLDAERGEIKSMRAAAEYRGRGAGEAILLHLLHEAQSRGYGWLGLETGGTEPFHPAHALYRKHGFTECAAFDGYVVDEFSICMSRTLG